MIEPEPAGAQPAAQQIDKDEGAEVADVSEIVHGGAAGVHANDVVRERSEGLDGLRQRVIEAQRHKRWEVLIVALQPCESCKSNGLAQTEEHEGADLISPAD